MSDTPTFPAEMPPEYIRNERPVGAIAHGTPYLIDMKEICLDRDGGTWVKATGRAVPLRRHIKGYLAIRMEDDGSLLLYGFDDPYLTFALSIHESDNMKRKGYIPVHLIDPFLTTIGEVVPESEHDEHA